MAAVVASNMTWNTTAGNKSVAPTLAVGELIIVIQGQAGLTTGLGASDTGTGGTYTQVGSYALNNTSVDSLSVWVRNNLVSVAGATTISTTGAGSSTGGGLCAIRISGMPLAGTAAIRTIGGVQQFAKQQNQAAGTPAPALTNQTTGENLMIGAIMDTTNGSANCTPPTGWAELQDAGFNSPPTGIEVCSRDSGQIGATTITFGAATPSGFAAVVIELETNVPLPALTLAPQRAM